MPVRIPAIAGVVLLAAAVSAVSLLFPRTRDAAPIAQSVTNRTGSCFFIAGTYPNECDYRDGIDNLRTDARELRHNAVLVYNLGVVDNAVTNPECAGPPCTGFSHAPTEQDAREAAARLGRLGYPGAVVRIAGAGDLATEGSLEYVVPLGQGCLIGGYSMLPANGWHGIFGTLPNGNCL